jgi:hypothetical protein
MDCANYEYRSLRAMIAEFVFFIGIAAICFSGLLFTLWTLGMKDLDFKQPRLRPADLHETAKDTDRHEDTWTVKAIAWLMVQIWFGNTYLSFGQASSFHPLFGPILMTGFAALSNTLLLTSEYQNTFDGTKGFPHIILYSSYFHIVEYGCED